MRKHLHLLGGNGRIGQKLINSLRANPVSLLKGIWVYCNANNASRFDPKKNINECNFPVIYKNYSGFDISKLIVSGEVDSSDEHIVINFRGVNNKLEWINNPLASLEIQYEAANNIIESDIWMYKNSEIIHLSSQLCTLIEGKYNLQEICEGEDSYRSPYMISRLHQEAMLTAFAFRNGIHTKFLRLPAVYGFEDDYKSPWVLNAFVKQGLANGKIFPRNPSSYVWLTHEKVLIEYLRKIITSQSIKENTISHINPPSIGLTVSELAMLVMSIISNTYKTSDATISLKHQNLETEEELKSNLNLLVSSIGELINRQKQ